MKILRWILVLPVAICAFAAVLFGVPIIGLSLSQAGIVSEGLVLDPTASVLGVVGVVAVNFSMGALPTWTAMKIAPSHRNAVGGWILILLVLVHVYFYLFDGTQTTGFLLVKDLAVLAGAWSGYRMIAETWKVP